jgi:hypothetical protein
LEVRLPISKATAGEPNGLLLFPQQVFTTAFSKVTAHNSFSKSHIPTTQTLPFVDGVFWYTKHVHYTLVWI